MNNDDKMIDYTTLIYSITEMALVNTIIVELPFIIDYKDLDLVDINLLINHPEIYQNEIDNDLVNDIVSFLKNNNYLDINLNEVLLVTNVTNKELLLFKFIYF